MASVLERLRDALAPDYTVEHEIATGGMGTVYRGRDVRLDRPVAIKALRPELATAVAVERFLREAQYLASMNHPNILPIHRVGQADGLIYYIMQYVEGKTLDARLAEGRLSLSETLALGRGLLAALAATHARGIIHRDIKPANIFLAGSRPMLGDFGVASSMGAELTVLTQPGRVVGTPYYMSPEQTAGRELTARSDLYARWGWFSMRPAAAAGGSGWRGPRRRIGRVCPAPCASPSGRRSSGIRLIGGPAP